MQIPTSLVIKFAAIGVFISALGMSTAKATSDSCADYPGIAYVRSYCEGLWEAEVLYDDCNSGTGIGAVMCDCTQGPWSAECESGMPGVCNSAFGTPSSNGSDQWCYWPDYCTYWGC